MHFPKLTITAIALAIGGLEGLGLLTDTLGLQGGLWRGVAMLSQHMSSVGYAAVVLLVLFWALSALNYRRKNYDALIPSGHQ
ncbi:MULTISPECIES: hypothetical protein [unclassified Serratia (in: enterobacteria)]|uniref:hypothetical protein n=1 Tax=unclassified Serratia (in: enterobacteria) TaxID=2647522 RepID=UPI003075FA58